MGDNCIALTTIVLKNNWLIKVWQSISALGPEDNNDVNVVDIFKSI